MEEQWPPAEGIPQIIMVTRYDILNGVPAQVGIFVIIINIFSIHYRKTDHTTSAMQEYYWRIIQKAIMY